jgi:uncharacterized NAD-dependent epimerase/dehydratase family protein
MSKLIYNEERISEFASDDEITVAQIVSNSFTRGSNQIEPIIIKKEEVKKSKKVNDSKFFLDIIKNINEAAKNIPNKTLAVKIKKDGGIVKLSILPVPGSA